MVDTVAEFGVLSIHRYLTRKNVIVASGMCEGVVIPFPPCSD
jgi:hypothetical protein